MVVDLPSCTVDPTLLQRLKGAVWSKKPILGRIIERLGKKSLLEYVQGYTPTEMHALMKGRLPEFLSTFRQEVTETLSPEDGDIAASQLAETLYVATNDHHGPINAFDAFNAHLALSLASSSGSIPALKAILVLSCCNVSLNNVSFPRGLLYSVDSPKGVTMRRLSLLKFEHGHSLYGYRPYGMEELGSMRKNLRQAMRQKEVPASVATKLEWLIDTVLSDVSIVGRKTYAAQASIVNRRLWDLVFEGHEVPRMIEVTQERLVAKLLTEHHLGRGTLLDACLFSPDVEALLLKHFDGIYGAFDTKEHIGTYLFWGRQHAGHRVRMIRRGAFLESEDGTLQISWEPAAVMEAMRHRNIIPSLLLVFLVLSFYYGLKCLGGYSQVNYLTYMKEAWRNVLLEMGDSTAVEACELVGTKHWSGFTLSYIAGANALASPAQFLDLFLYHKSDTWSRLMAYASELSLEDAVVPLLPEMYRYGYGETERQPDLLSITPEQLINALRIRPSLFVGS